MPGTKAPEDLLRRIRQGNRFLLTSHVNPDGDAIGSELGLARVLRGLGKLAVVWNRDVCPTVYHPLPAASASTAARSRRPVSPRSSTRSSSSSARASTAPGWRRTSGPCR